MLYKTLLWINLSLLYIHEMDAVHTREWKMMIFFNRISDEAAHRLFTAAHFFLFLGIFWLIEYRFTFIFWFTCIFSLFHLFLHIAFRKHAENRMGNMFSGSVIILMFIVSCISIFMYLNALSVF